MRIAHTLDVPHDLSAAEIVTTFSFDEDAQTLLVKNAIGYATSPRSILLLHGNTNCYLISLVITGKHGIEHIL